MKQIKAWIEAMRLRTLPVSASGVVVAGGLAASLGGFEWLPWALCLAFALLAQTASNFANEYYDFRAGLDRKGREGPRRGVTEGDISPTAMIAATFATLAVACAIGLSLIAWGGWLLLPVGFLTALGALAYSAGPYPLSRHAMGEVAVVVFFGMVPVNMTVYILTGQFYTEVALMSVAVGLLGANILVVNNYRDADDDAAVGKHTLATRFGRRFASTLYLLNGLIAMVLAMTLFAGLPIWALAAPAIYLTIHILLWRKLLSRQGRELNPLLGMTAANMLLFSLLTAAELITI